MANIGDPFAAAEVHRDLPAQAALVATVNAAKQLFATLADERVFTVNDLGTDGTLTVAEARASYQKASAGLAAALREVAAAQQAASAEPSAAEVAQLRAEVAAAEEALRAKSHRLRALLDQLLLLEMHLAACTPGAAPLVPPTASTASTTS